VEEIEGYMSAIGLNITAMLAVVTDSEAMSRYGG